MNKFTIWCDSEFLQAFGRREMAQTLSRPRSTSIDLSRPQSTSSQTLQKPSWIEDLGILIYIFRKSATRRFSWSNSQLLILKTINEHCRLMFLLGETSSREHRFEIIVDNTWGYVGNCEERRSSISRKNNEHGFLSPFIFEGRWMPVRPDAYEGIRNIKLKVLQKVLHAVSCELFIQQWCHPKHDGPPV